VRPMTVLVMAVVGPERRHWGRVARPDIRGE